MSSPLDKLQFCTTNIVEPQEAVLRRLISDMGGVCKKKLETATRFLILGDLGGKRWTPKYNFALEMRPDIVLLIPEAIEKLHMLWMEGQDFDGRQELESMRVQPFQGLRVSFTNLPGPERDFLKTVIRDGGGEPFDSLMPKCHILVSGLDKGRKVDVARGSWNIPVVVPEWIIKSLERGAAWSPEMFLIEVPPEDRKKSLCSESASIVFTSMAGTTPSIAKSARSRVSSSAWDSLMGAPAKRMALSRPESSSASPTPQPAPNAQEGLFENLTFALYGFDDRQKAILQKTLTSHGAAIDQDEHDYMIVNSSCSECPKTDAHIITEWAIERSLHKKARILTDIWGKFIKHRSIAQFEGLKICISGYSGVELLHLTRLIPLVGGDFCATLTSQRDLLISTPDSNKFKHAQSWDIPIVNERWIWQCAEQGALLPLKEFLLEGSTCESLARVSVSDPAIEPEVVEEPIPLKVPAATEVGIAYDESDNEHMASNFVRIKPAVNARRRI
ncbi:S-M checkpoint control protein rad4 [Wickerhamiella sorbophila]|uniref:S-M checkpoint control protein rad4 n=1 Tax=Wickerhamiella sorbophila TaxID=45607 RepID=A0A2T0FC02_9ASCO|nr:S-M checkpoint control protein rad4 [Wickerhamiella sorbophila]PRT52469.1 S-M checkpoint control protein rad4 [Wickerhamiella sorbophila]